MHGWGQWYALLAAALIIGCYVCGRRGLTWAVAAAVCAAEVGATVAVASRHDVASWLVDQVVVVIAVFAALSGAYRRLRHELTLRGWSHAQDAQLRERARIAADIHDTLGHDLTLLSLQAAGIQVTATEPEIRERAAKMRAGAADAIGTVRRLVDLLGVEPDPDAAAAVERSRAAGMAVSVTGELPRGALAGRLVAEALANAAAHAPGQPVSIAFSGAGRLEIANPLPPDVRDSARAGESRVGTGLATLAARLARAGGSLDVDTTGGCFRLIGHLPDGAERDAAQGPATLAAEYALRRNRARRVLALATLAPLAALVVLATGFYAWASHDATVEPGTYRKMHVGMTEGDAIALLPRRQSPIRVGAEHQGCRYYSNGNYPLAYGNYEICFRDGKVSSLRDSTGGER